MRSHDIIEAAEAYSHNLPGLLSLECWGGASFDVAYRFLKECPWQRLRDIRSRAPNLLTPDAAPRLKRCGVHKLPGQCDSILRQAGGSFPASTFSGSSTASIGWRTCGWPWTRSLTRERSAKPRSATPATSPTPSGRSYDLNYYVALATRTEDGRCPHAVDQGHGGGF